VSFPKTITLQSYFYTKIIILGDNEVGKSSLISTFCYGLNDISKIKAATHHRKDITIDDISTQIHDRSPTWFGTGISIKSGGVKLVLWA
jgi:GTPase SAR1 family protein